MKRRILLLSVTAMLVVMMVATSALPALAQLRTPSCDWYPVSFERRAHNTTAWYAYWCHWPGYGWYLHAWWSKNTSTIWVG
jgi:hypothetical protein